MDETTNKVTQVKDSFDLCRVREQVHTSMNLPDRVTGLAALLADSTIEVSRLRARVADLEADRDSYRLLAQQTLHALHHVTLERDVLRAQRGLDRRREREQVDTSINLPQRAA
jgi:hypothetical protein